MGKKISDKKKTEASTEFTVDYSDIVEFGKSVVPSKLDTSQLVIQEQKRRNSKVQNARLLFRAIDILFYSPQNSSPYINKSNIGTVSVIPDILYSDVEPTVCRLDFYRVESEKKQPAILLIHGGGFTAGDKKYRKGRAQFFAINGFSVFCVNYGLAPKYHFPDPLEHIVSAANYIHDHADEYNIDPDRIFVDGDSAGGYYAAMVAAFNCNPRLGEVFGFAPKFRIFGALLNCGVYDMQTVLNTKYPFDIADGVILSLTGISGRDFESYSHKEVCVPIELVNKDFPPTFMVYSKNDAFCKGQGEIMQRKLEEVGAYCEYYVSRHGMSNHCFSLTWKGEDATAANELMISFAKRLSNDKIKL